MEKEYKFHHTNAGSFGHENVEKIESIKESELTENHKNLLYDHLIRTWNDTPAEIQIKFLHEMYKILTNIQ